jgi:hypothetical protein
MTYELRNEHNSLVGFAYQGKDIVFSFIIKYSNPVHNAPVPPPPPHPTLLRTGSNLSSCTVVVNAPQSCWPDVIQKKKR